MGCGVGVAATRHAAPNARVPPPGGCMRLAVAAPLLLGLVAPAAVGTARAQCAVAAIDTLLIENAGVADGGLAEALHIRTRAGVIRRAVPTFSKPAPQKVW